MLALEPGAQIISSVEVNPGVAEPGRFIAREFEIEEEVTQPVFYEKLDTTIALFHIDRRLKLIDRVDNLVRLKVWFDGDYVDTVEQQGLLRTTPPNDFKIKRKLYVVYPADPEDTGKLAEGLPRPVVVLVHGNHAWYDDTAGQPVPNHRGYIYLQKELASWGIVSVSVDTNVANAFNQYIEMRAEMVLKALDVLWTMNADATSRFHGRLDFDNVGMMGHSRGGDAVVRAAIINADASARATAGITGKYKIKAVCSLAPSDFTGTTSSRNRLDPGKTSFYSVIYGALDGDLAGFGGAYDGTGTGFRHYDRATTQKSMVFLDACGHNRFNDTWTEDDAGRGDTDVIRLVSRPGHRALANEYIGGLFRWQLLGKKKPASLFDGASSNSIKALASIQWSFGKKQEVLDDMETASASNVGTRSPTAVLSNMASVSIGGTLLAKRTNHQTRVLVLDPASASPYKLVLPPSHQDWRQYDQFTFRVCADVDETDAASLAASPLPDFMLVFTDSLNGSAQVTAASLRTLDRPRSPVLHMAKDPGTGSDENCTAIRLETLAVNLTRLAGVDRSKMAAIELIPATGFLKHQFFDSFQLVKR